MPDKCFLSNPFSKISTRQIATRVISHEKDGGWAQAPKRECQKNNERAKFSSRRLKTKRRKNNSDKKFRWIILVLLSVIAVLKMYKYVRT